MRESGKTERGSWFGRRTPGLIGALCAAGLLFAAGHAFAQVESGGDSFEDRSLALRTALHYDPSIEGPLRSLIKLYGEAGRVDELLSVYRSHLLKYPNDASAQAVLIRLFRETSNPEAGIAARAAVVRYPEDDLLRYLYFEELDSSRDPAALEELSKALSLTKLPNRRRAWLDELLSRCVSEGRGDLARKHLAALLEASESSAEMLLGLARKMTTCGLNELALETLERASTGEMAPELSVEIELLAARAEAAMGRTAEAAKRLDDLLSRVAPDYWRRSQIVVERVHLLGTDAARGEMLRAARERFEANPGSEAAALDLAEVLVASELRRDALAILLKTSGELPYSEPLERKTIELLDRLGDERSAREYLEKRLRDFPDRLDLRYRLVKALYLSGHSEEAREEFSQLVVELKQEERFKQQLDLARFLRRMNQPADAVEIFEKVVAGMPGRVDVLRELGEAYLAIGRRESARRLFAEAMPAEAKIENFLDVVQFLVQQGMLLEAAGFIEDRLLVEDSNFDLRLLAIDVYGKSGEQLAGEALIPTTRELADTQARYQRWLETAAGFFEIFEGEESFFEGEESRLVEAPGAWSEERVSRFLAYCEVAGRRRQQEKVAAVLRDRVFDENLPTEVRTRLRRMLVDSLERDPLSAGELEEHLAVLMREDHERIHEYRLRQARLHRSANRPDLILPLLEDLDVEQIGDVLLLAGSIDLFVELNLTLEARQALERLTVLDADTLSHWEKLLGVLGSLGDEEALRRSIRRLLAGAERAELEDESVTALQLHLLDSYWRSIAGVLSAGAEGRYAELFNILNEIEREGARRQDQLWVFWTRAYLLNEMGQTRARDEAIETLLQAATRDAAAVAESAEEKRVGESDEAVAPSAAPRIAFPDGLSVSLEHALATLREPAGRRRAEMLEAGSGPAADLGLAWVFESDPGTAIVQMESDGKKAVLFLDDQGNLYRVAKETGKLSWRKKRGDLFGDAYHPPNRVTSQASGISGNRSGLPRNFHLHGGYGSGLPNGGTLAPSRLRLAPRFAIADSSRMLVPAGGNLRCFDTRSGVLRWVSEVGGEVPPFHPDQAGSVPPELQVFPSGDRVFTFAPRSGTACCVALETGKLIWRSEVYAGIEGAGAVNPILFGLNAGASFADGKLLVYGRRAAVVDCRDGGLTWTFEGKNVRSFPVGLRSRAEQKGNFDAALAPISPGVASPAYRPAAPTWIDHLSTGTERSGKIPSFLKYRGALVAPAIQWVQLQSQKMQVARGELRGSQMLLMGPAGLQQFSLELPLGARTYPVTGTLAGFAGGRACVLKGNEVILLNLGRGSVNRFRIDELEPDAEVEVALSGPRVYLSSRAGVHCVNAHTGRLLFRADWPAELSTLIDGGGAATESGGKVEYYWSGVAGSANGKAGYCVVPRNRVVGDTLLAIIAPGKAAALVPAR